jgi:3-oxoadipate enol-lactonase
MNDLSVDLYYEEMGQGKPLIFLHGYPLDHATWLPIAALLKEKARCILPDLRGLGKSPVTGTETTIRLMAEDVIRLMDQLKIEKAVISGHSMGGYIAMQLAHSFPGRVCGLGLIATRAEADSAEQAASRLAIREDSLRNGPAKLIQNMASRLTDRIDIKAEILSVMKNTDPRGIAMAQYAITNRENAEPWLLELDYPVVVVAGDKDVINTEDISKNIVAHLRNGKYYASPTASHMLPMEEPELVVRALEETYLS